MHGARGQRNGKACASTTPSEATSQSGRSHKELPGSLAVHQGAALHGCNIRMVKRSLASILVVFMALMPMSVLAGYSSGPTDTQEMPCHAHDGNQPDQGSNACGDMKGCCGGFLTPALAQGVEQPAASERALVGESRHSGFVPDHVDPPPVVL